MSSPNLFIRRIVVEGELSYDQRFYPGLNIVHAIQTNNDPRSTNGCGKTSLVELIQHGLGKRQESKAKFHFAPIMDQLRTLFLEIETGSGVYTIERSLQAIIGAARFHEGAYVPGMDKTPAEVVSIDNMSSLILGLTGIPEVSVNTQQGERAPLSFPLLMRAFILHQEDSFGEILAKVQPETRKADILGFLTGITPLDRFPIEEKIGEVTRAIQQKENYVTSVAKFLLDNNVPSPIEAVAQVDNARLALQEAKNEQLALQHSIILLESNDRRGQTDELRRRLLSIKQEISVVEQSFLGLHQEEERIKDLIASLRSDQQKSRHLQAATIQLNHVEFQFCPRCLQEITIEMRQREQSARCALCNRPLIVTSDTPPRRIFKTDDIDLQIQEAEQILSSVRKERELSERQLVMLRDEEGAISQDLGSQTAAYVSPAVDQLVAQANLISERQAALEKAVALQKQAESLEFLRADLNDLRTQLASLQDELSVASQAKKQRREALRQTYEHVLQAIDFPKVQEVTISSQTLMPNINGQLYIHQGTALKGLATVCYHLALLALAKKEETFFPKMLVIDSPNTGDLNEDSHTKLLRYLASLQADSATTELDWQIILTTRYLPAELELFVREKISSPSMRLLRKR